MANSQVYNIGDRVVVEFSNGGLSHNHIGTIVDITQDANPYRYLVRIDDSTTWSEVHCSLVSLSYK